MSDKKNERVKTVREQGVEGFEAKRKELKDAQEAKALEKAKEAPHKSFKTSLNTSVHGITEEEVFYSYLVPIDCALIGFGAMLVGSAPKDFRVVVRRKLNDSIKTDAFVIKPGTNTIKEVIPLVQGSLLSLAFSSPSVFNIEDFHITLIIESKDERI